LLQEGFNEKNRLDYSRTVIWPIAAYTYNCSAVDEYQN
jgi:hypothetical protein